jgi:hypothetical protein
MTFRELLDLDKQPPATVRQPQGRGHRRAPRRPDAMTDATAACHHDTTVARYDDSAASAMLDALRLAVRRIGKEAATYRFTREEKERLAEIIYRQSRAGVRTCENEIVRIGVNWLLQDHRARGDASLLSLALKALHA